jgi:hypothetical protein
MRENFEQSVALILDLEGGGQVVQDSLDPGGKTRWGISQRAYPALDIEGLTLGQAKEIYRQDYWVKAGCDELPGPMDLCAFDCAVNMGVGKALELLRNHPSWEAYLLRRLAYYKALGNRRFFAGWVNRVLRLYEYIALRLTVNTERKR